MKFTGNQKNLYLLALILFFVSIVLVCVWTFTGNSREASSIAWPTPAPQSSQMSEVLPTAAPDAQAVSQNTKQQMVSTIVYYQDNYGYLVPVMCNVAYEDGIAKATLGRMIQSSENDMAAARLGLRTVLPEGTSIDLDIHDGLARIDLSSHVLKMADAAAENNMITAIVQTLTEFDSVKQVEFLVAGQKREKLTHGTDISQKFERGEINMETSVETMASTALEPVQLYFSCDSASVVVPVTRMVYANADINTAVLELTKGPVRQSPLEGVLPDGCGLIGVTVENGVAKVNFTKEFAQMVQESDGGRMALKALVLTCTQFEGVKGVEVYVEGEKYDPGAGTLDVPSFANVAQEIESAYIQTQSNMIFDFE